MNLDRLIYLPFHNVGLKEDFLYVLVLQLFGEEFACIFILYALSEW